MKNRLLILGIFALLLVTVAPASAIVLNGAQWRILDRVQLPNGNWNYATRHPYNLDGGITGVAFPFLTPTDGYTNYMILNYNKDLTGKTITASINIDAVPETTFTYRGCPGANAPSVRIEFQSTSAGKYTPNDYWWSADSANLASIINNPDILIVEAKTDVLNRAKWTNIAGKPATDTTEPWTNYDGTIETVSPYDGYTNALKDVKEVTLSFGGGSCYANGVAVTDGGSATFELLSFGIS